MKSTDAKYLVNIIDNAISELKDITDNIDDTEIQSRLNDIADNLAITKKDISELVTLPTYCITQEKLLNNGIEDNIRNIIKEIYPDGFYVVEDTLRKISDRGVDITELSELVEDDTRYKNLFNEIEKHRAEYFNKVENINATYYNQNGNITASQFAVDNDYRISKKAPSQDKKIWSERCKEIEKAKDNYFEKIIPLLVNTLTEEAEEATDDTYC